MIPYDHQPFSADPFGYPSAFGVLNAIWCSLASITPVQVVNLQITVQACLAVGLILKCIISLRQTPPTGVMLLVVAAAHWIFTMPSNSEAAYLQGTPRLAHSAFAILPLTFIFYLHHMAAPLARLRWCVVLVGSFCVAWAVSTNPAHIIVIIPVVIAALLLLPHLESASTGRSPKPPRSNRRIVLLTMAVPLLLVSSDGWLVPWWSPCPRCRPR